MTVLGRGGVEVEAVTAASMPIAKFSRWCSAVHQPPPSSPPLVTALRRYAEAMTGVATEAQDKGTKVALVPPKAASPPI
jgi:hypothetical protein